MTEQVNHPEHYNEGPVECIEVISSMDCAISNIMKYLWRKNLKGNPTQDLKKAMFYIDYELSIRMKRNLFLRHSEIPNLYKYFSYRNRTPKIEEYLMYIEKTNPILGLSLIFHNLNHADYFLYNTVYLQNAKLYLTDLITEK